LSDINSDRRAKLSIPTGTFTFSFTDLSKLSKEQLAIWDASRKEAIVQDGKIPEMEEYFESVKTSIVELEKSMKSDKKLDDYSLTTLGWAGEFQNGSHKSYDPIIYGDPSAIFASKQILDPLMNNYRKSIEDEDQKEKAKLKQQSDSSSGF
jgi:hypothetical protein